MELCVCVLCVDIIIIVTFQKKKKKKKLRQKKRPFFSPKTLCSAETSVKT